MLAGLSRAHPEIDVQDHENVTPRLLEEGGCIREQALSFFHMPGTVRHGGLDDISLAILVQMVGSGIGVMLTPEMAVPVETCSAEVSIPRFLELQPSRTIGMEWRRSSALAELLGGIAGLVREAAGSY